MTFKRCKQCGRRVFTAARRCSKCGSLLRPLLSTRATILLLYLGAACLLAILAFLVAVDPRL